MQNDVYSPLKQGVKVNGNLLEISIYSPQATSIFFQLFDTDNGKIIQNIPLTKDKDSLFFASIPTPDPNHTYLYLVDGNEVVDPFSKALNFPNDPNNPYIPKGQFTFDHTFDWEDVAPPKVPFNELIIYEMHVKGFTYDPSSKSNHPGTYLGAIEKIPYLKSLGINAVELMPIFEFDRLETNSTNPITHEDLVNYWGYNTSNFFCPTRNYATSQTRLGPITELKTLIKELHKAGIQVFLDVVYNHVSKHMGLEAISKSDYFILTEDGNHTNYTGCGNTLNANANPVMNLIISSLTYFAEEFHIDGFRYDLGGSLLRGEDGKVKEDAPLFSAILDDPLLKEKTHIVEPWDAAGLNHLGHFGDPLICEWNGEFKYSARKFLNLIDINEASFQNALLGTPQIFKDQKPVDRQVHYVTSHDGFSLYDLVSYSTKVNEENGEENKDGENDNFSNNWGTEGETSDQTILKKRKIAVYNFLMVNLLAKGVPMITMGDEFGHSRNGNNNPYCQDNPISWINWDMVIENADQVEFVSKLCQLRNKYILNARDTSSLICENGVVALSYDKQAVVAFNMSDTPFDLTSLLNRDWKCEISSNKSDSLLLQPNSSLMATRVK